MISICKEDMETENLETVLEIIEGAGKGTGCGILWGLYLFTLSPLKTTHIKMYTPIGRRFAVGIGLALGLDYFNSVLGEGSLWENVSSLPNNDLLYLAGFYTSFSLMNRSKRTKKISVDDLYPKRKD